jgi:hypothetical protein
VCLGAVPVDAGQQANQSTAPTGAGLTADAGATDGSVRPYVTVRFFAGPGVNLMRDWREGFDALESIADGRGLRPHGQCCVGISWGATALVHVTDRVAGGASVEALRDTRKFLVTDLLEAFGIHRDAEYSFSNTTEVEAWQMVVAFYPRSVSHTHVQAAAGIATGRTTLSTPGSSSSGRLRAPVWSFSAGTESRYWYVDAGWRFLPMRAAGRTAGDFDIAEARDVFPDVTAVEQFVRGRDTDLSGAWARVGLALHLGRRRHP